MGELPCSRKMGQYLWMHDNVSPLFSAPFDLARLSDHAEQVDIKADTSTRAAIAAAFNLPAIAVLRGRFVLSPTRAHHVAARLDLAAEVTQTCVVSLDPVEQSIAERASLILLTQAQATKHEAEAAELNPDAPDEIIADGTIVDLGAILLEQFALALDPYPRKPDAVPASAPDSAPEPPHPFAALGRLRKPE